MTVNYSPTITKSVHNGQRVVHTWSVIVRLCVGANVKIVRKGRNKQLTLQCVQQLIPIRYVLGKVMLHNIKLVVVKHLGPHRNWSNQIPKHAHRKKPPSVI